MKSVWLQFMMKPLGKGTHLCIFFSFFFSCGSDPSSEGEEKISMHCSRRSSSLWFCAL